MGLGNIMEEDIHTARIYTVDVVKMKCASPCALCSTLHDLIRPKISRRKPTSAASSPVSLSERFLVAIDCFLVSRSFQDFVYNVTFAAATM